MNAPLAVLLRNGTHAAATVRLALKAEQLAITYVRSPIQIPQVQGNPTIFDLGQVRPAMTLSGLVDNIGTSLDQTTANYGYNMEALTISGQTYYVPYKNYLESKLVTWLTDDGYEVQVEIGDATTPDYSGSGTTASTGGGIYPVAIQQVQFTQTPGTEDRWMYSISFVAKLRTGIAF
tara:strand:+ start:43 stop:573 length:531 start_codon:yes stop_codon:yes gene_type:complete